MASTLERLAPLDEGGETTTFQPGAVPAHVDRFVYSARFTNRGAELLDGIRITSPIPPELRYLPQSATGPATTVLFSVDRGQTFRPARELAVAQADGNFRAAEPADYTHVRWVIDGPLDPGATGVVRFGAVPR